MNKKVKQWYENVIQKTTKEEEWSEETIELGKEELDQSLIPKEEMKVLKENVLVNFYSREDDIVYTFISTYRKDHFLICLLRNGKLKNSDYLVVDDDG